MGILFQRVWGMPSADTFDCEPIKGFVQKYLMKSKVSVDPFARNKRWATWTNDLDPETAAQSHIQAKTYLKERHYDGILADLIILDPPYSPRQISECYERLNLSCSIQDSQNGRMYKEVKDAAEPVCAPGGIVLCFGWNSSGMGKERGFELVEVLLVCHGGAHNDTICTAEKKLNGHPILL